MKQDSIQQLREELKSMLVTTAEQMNEQALKADARPDGQAQQMNEKLDAVQEGLGAVTQEVRRFMTE